MKIVILGTRGVPASYGGFETLAEELGARLAARGHQVTVYGRRSNIHQLHPENKYRGMWLKQLPTIPHKYLDTVVNTFLSVFHVAATDAEVVLACNVANSPFVWLPRLAGKPTVLNVDGLDRKRRKWNWIGRAYLLLCEWLALVTPTVLVTDAEVIRDYYRRHYRKQSALIAYGADRPNAGRTAEIPERFGLVPGEYVLYVSRLEPENNPALVINAFESVRTDWRLAMVGGNPYRSDFVDGLKRMADGRVIFTGPIYGDGYWQLQRHAGLYVHATEVGGTHPALIEAMACGRCVLYLNTPENAEVIADAGIPFEASALDLAQKMEHLLADAETRARLGSRAFERAREHYDWDKITTQYEDLFSSLLNSGRQ